jgi:hypothetical protein
VWPSVVGLTRFCVSARVHASTARHLGGDLAFERHLAGGPSAVPVPAADKQPTSGTEMPGRSTGWP